MSEVAVFPEAADGGEGDFAGVPVPAGAGVLDDQPAVRVLPAFFFVLRKDRVRRSERDGAAKAFLRRAAVVGAVAFGGLPLGVRHVAPEVVALLGGGEPAFGIIGIDAPE